MAFAPTPLLAAAWLAVLALGGFVLHVGRTVLIPLALALLICQLINAAAVRLQRVRIRGWAPGVWQQTALSVLLLALLVYLIVDLILSNVGAVSAAAPIYEANLMALLPRLADMVGLPHPESLRAVVGGVELDVLIRGIASTMVSFVGSLGLVGLYVAFILLEQGSFMRKIDALFPDRERARAVRAIVGQIELRIERYLWIKTLMSLLTAGLSWVVLALIGCQNASFWALIVFMINYIPFLGSVIGVLFPALLVLVQFGSFGPFLAAVVGLSIVQFGVGSILDPRLMGSSLNLSPLAILVSLAVWGGLWGIAGMFLCVPITAAVMIVCAHFAPTRPFAILLSIDGRLSEQVAAPATVAASSANAAG